LAADGVWLGFGLFLLFEIAAGGLDEPAAYEEGDEDADGVADVAAVAGEIGDEFYEEGEQGEEDEAPDEGPVLQGCSVLMT